jgi:hypothetical protein
MFMPTFPGEKRLENPLKTTFSEKQHYRKCILTLHYFLYVHIPYTLKPGLFHPNSVFPYLLIKRGTAYPKPGRGLLLVKTGFL